MFNFILFAIFNAAIVSAVKINIGVLNKQSFDAGENVIKPIMKAQADFAANLGRFQNLNNVTGDFNDIANMLFKYGKIFIKLTTSYNKLTQNLQNPKSNNGKMDINIPTSQFNSLLSSYENLAIGNSNVKKSLYKLGTLLQYLTQNFYKVKVINGRIYLPKTFFNLYNNDILESADDFTAVATYYKQLRKLILQIASQNIPASSSKILTEMAARYEKGINWFTGFANIFYQLEASAVKYTGNLNVAVGGRCTSEDLEKLLTKINYVVANLIPEFSSVVKTYVIKANMY